MTDKTLSLSFYLSSSAVNVLSSEHDNHSWIKRKWALRPSIHWATARQAVSCLSEEFASSFWWTPSREWYPPQGNINKTCPLVKWLFVSLRISVLGQVRAISGSIGTSPFLSFRKIHYGLTSGNNNRNLNVSSHSRPFSGFRTLTVLLSSSSNQLIFLPVCPCEEQSGQGIAFQFHTLSLSRELGRCPNDMIIDCGRW